MASRLDIIIFGASGFTAKYVLMQAHKLFKNVTWGVAGRNESKIKKILQETVRSSGVSDFEYIPVIYANIDDEKTIKNMTSQAKMIINCCGPCDLYGGQIVVQCCIETGTHYVDISAEKSFISNISKYGKSAEEKGVFIVNLCGFNSVPYDLGVCFIEEKFEGILNSMEIYFDSIRGKSRSNGPSFNYTTWKSFINTLAKHKQLKSTEKQLNEKKNVECKPKLTTKLPHKVKEGLAIPYPGADEDTIRNSQLYFYEHGNKRPVQVRNYIIMHSFYSIVITVLLGLLCFILAQFAFGRSLLLKYPYFFSYGTFSHEKPSEDDLNKRSFSLTFKGRGWSDKQQNYGTQCQTQPNKEIIGCISGNNPAYGFTGLTVALCALTILLEPKNLPPRGGIYTPAVAFSKTSLIEQLQNNGVKFEVLSIRDLK